MNIYDFTVKDAEGNLVPLSKYKGKTLLIFNSATTCYFTPQYKGLQKLYEEMKDRDFEILDFPCNQFGNQAGPAGSDAFCCCRNKYGVNFDLFGLVDVNGENADPLFKYLEEQTRFEGFGLGSNALRANIAYHTIKKSLTDKASEIHWNFTKFLINNEGEVVARFEASEPIELVRNDVNRLLNGEKLSIKNRFYRKCKDTKSSAEKRMHLHRMQSMFFFFLLTYIITLIFDLLILQKNGISVFRNGIIPGMPSIDSATAEAAEKIVQQQGNVLMGRIFSDSDIVRKQYLLPLPSSLFLALAFECIFRKNSKKINQLCAALEQASAGNFNYRLKTSEKDLFYRPFNDFNAMSLELKENVKSLEKAVKEADEANEAKSNFLSNMSHEIRTPLNAVLGMDEMILRESTEDNVIAYANDIKNAGKTLLSLINDILDFSKIEANKLDIIPVEYDLSSLINDLVNMSTHRANAKGLELTFDVDETMPHLLRGDEIRVKQICTNIITNAIKYTDEGSINVSFCRENVDGENAIRFICKDTGQGISPEDIHKLTEPFARINERKNRTIEGTGLGMSITTSLLDQMGSRLEVDSSLGEGSTFSFTVKQPVVSDEPIGDFMESYRKLVGEQEKYVESFHAPKAHILVVDDVEMNLTVAKSFLKKTLINVDTATSGAQALELVDREKYDLIFLDHMMPDMDGIDTLKAIRAGSHENSEVPIVVLTANAVSGSREKYLAAGFSDYLTKPIDSKKLEALIVKFLPPELVERTVDSDDFMDSGDLDAGCRELLNKISAIDGVDISEGINNSGGEEAYITVVENFANTARSRAELIDEYRAAGDFKNYTIQVHALKSSARLVGQMDLSNLAKYLEQCGNDENSEEILNRTDELLLAYINLADSLKNLFDIKTDKPLIDADLLKDGITSLYEALQTFDIDMADSIISTLNEYSMPAAFSSTYEEIKVLMSSVDRDGVMTLIDNNKDFWR